MDFVGNFIFSKSYLLISSLRARLACLHGIIEWFHCGTMTHKHTFVQHFSPKRITRAEEKDPKILPEPVQTRPYAGV